MNASLGWALAVVGIAMGYMAYGWQGVALALSVIVFWLLLQFSRAMRVMRIAGQAPVGMVPSAVMVHATLQKGQRLMEVIMRTKSLGEKVDSGQVAAGTEVFRWRDEAGAQVTVTLLDGRVTDWALQRPDESEADDTLSSRTTSTPNP